MNVEVAFSRAGNPLYSYTNTEVRHIMLNRSVGQKVADVPADGGVQTVIVQSIRKQPERIALSLAGSFEKASNGYLDQHRETTVIEYILIPEGLRMGITTRSISHFGDKDMTVGGTPNQTVAEGILQKIN